MGRHALHIGLLIRRSAITTLRILCRSVSTHPFLVAILFFLLFLYRSSPFLFSLLLSSSPVLVCTALLLGTLLSFGETNFPLIQDKHDCDENTSPAVAEFKRVKDDAIDRDTECTELVAHASMLIDQNSREIQIGIGKQPIDETNWDWEASNLKAVEQKASLEDQNIQVSFSHDEFLENESCRKSLGEDFEDYKSAKESMDTQVRDQSDSSAGSLEQPDNVVEGSLSPVGKDEENSALPEAEVEAQNSEEYKLAQGSTDAQITRGDLDLDSLRSDHVVVEERLSPVQKVQAAVLAQLRNHLESSLGTWNRLDAVIENLPSSQKVQVDNSEDYKSAEGSADFSLTDQLESSLETWKHFSDENDDEEEDRESDSGSDGAESSSPDASMADIIPMLDELDPLLEDEDTHASNLSRQTSATTVARSGSIHSEDESDQKDEEVGDVKSDDDDEDDEEEEEETQGGKDDPDKSAFTWTEDDQKNLMDLGSSELERNQRLESLIARRRARRMMAERNLIDLDSMDLQFQIAPITTIRRNPFDLPHDSYDDLGLPPIPGSAPSVLLPRHKQNPFDLPYDSSEEKPDLMADSFQQEFTQLYQGETSNQREPVFRRNETFTAGSSIFGFGRYETARASRFRPYFVPERTDSDVMSYSSSLQRQSSELSEFNASAVTEAESTSVEGDEGERRPGEHDSAQEMEPTSEIDQASLLVELGSHSSDDLHSLSDKEKDFVLHVPEIELGSAAVSDTFETEMSAQVRLGDRENDPEAESWMLGGETSTDIVRESIAEKQDADSSSSSSSSSSLSSSSSSPKVYNDVKLNDVNEGLVNAEQSHVDDVHMLVDYSLQTSVSDVPTEHSLESSNFNHVTEISDVRLNEPIYDSSPQAVKRDDASSSVSLDMHIETSEIHLYQLPSVPRDILMTEETKVGEEDAKQSVLDEKQGYVDDLGLTMNQNEELKAHAIVDHSQFSDVPINEHNVCEEDAEQSALDEKQGSADDLGRTMQQNEEVEAHAISDHSQFSEDTINEPKICEEDAKQSFMDEKQGCADDLGLTMQQNEEVEAHVTSDHSQFSEDTINEPKIREEDTEQSVLDEKQRCIGDLGLTMQQNEEVEAHAISGHSQFSEVPINEPRIPKEDAQQSVLDETQSCVDDLGLAVKQNEEVEAAAISDLCHFSEDSINEPKILEDGKQSVLDETQGCIDDRSFTMQQNEEVEACAINDHSRFSEVPFDEPKIHEEDANQNVLDEKQGCVDDLGLAMKQNKEVEAHAISDHCQFSEDAINEPKILEEDSKQSVLDEKQGCIDDLGFTMQQNGEVEAHAINDHSLFSEVSFDDPEIHEEYAKQSVLDEKQGCVDDLGLAMKQNEEVEAHGITDYSHFSEVPFDEPKIHEEETKQSVLDEKQGCIDDLGLTMQQNEEVEAHATSDHSQFSEVPYDEPKIQEEDAKQIVLDEKQGWVDELGLTLEQSEELEAHAISDHSQFPKVPTNEPKILEEDSKPSVLDEKQGCEDDLSLTKKQNEEVDAHGISDHSQFSEVPIDEPKIHEEDAKQRALDENEGCVDDLGLTMRQNEELEANAISVHSQFSEVPINSVASVATEYEVQQTANSSDAGLVEDELSTA